VEALRQTMSAPAQAGITLTPVQPTPRPPVCHWRLQGRLPKIRPAYVILPNLGIHPCACRSVGVAPEQIISFQTVPAGAFIPPGQELWLAQPAGRNALPSAILPDGAVINSPSAAGFDAGRLIRQSGGYLSTYQGAGR